MSLIDIEKEFRYALQALAVSAEKQIAALQPGCITCELMNDFDCYYDEYRSHPEVLLTDGQKQCLKTIAEAIAHLPDEDCECWKNEVLEHSSWVHIRELAQKALDVFRWPPEPPPGFSETEAGVWRRE